MPLNGDAVIADGEQKLTRVSMHLLRMLNEALEKGAGTLVGKVQDANAKREKQKLLESYGITKEFCDYMQKGGRMQSVEVHKKDYLDFARELQKDGVPFLSSEIVGDDCLCIRYRDTDKERVASAIERFEESRKFETEMDPERFEKQYAGKGIKSIDGLDMVELEVIRHYAVDDSFQFAAVATGDGSTCKILFNDQDKMDDILKKLAWQMTGERGPLVREQIEYRISGRERSNRLSFSDTEKEYYMVSKKDPSNYVQVTADELALYKDNKVVTTVARGDTNYYERASTAVMGLEEPVILTSDEFTSNEKSSIISARQEVVPTGISAAENVLQEVTRQEKEAYEKYRGEMTLEDGYDTQLFDSLGLDDAHSEGAARYLHDKKIIVRDEFAVDEKNHNEQPSKDERAENER